MENIRYGKKDATEEEVIEAAKLAHIHDVIDDLPEKYNTLCGERGNNLSGGQRQRVVIARAILKNAPILILDEATSSLDSRTEGLIQGSLEYLMKNKTVLVIAHRLSTLLNMDRILVFSQGSILEDGKHEELLESGKLYKKLWKSQVKGFISDSPKNNKTIDE
jgi:ATP-binding cassette subfamily B protein